MENVARGNDIVSKVRWVLPECIPLCLKFFFTVYLCPQVTLLLLARSWSQIHTHISLAAALVSRTGLSASLTLTSALPLAFSPCILTGAVWEVFRIWELRRYFTRIKFTVKAWTKGLKCLVIACREADGHVNSGGPTKWQRRWVIISLPLPCHPRPVISGQNSQQRKQSLTPRLGSHFRCKTPGGWSDGGCHMLKCLLSWMRNNTQRKVSPL